jgi:hypothetical protein
MPRCLTRRLGCVFERDALALAFQRLNGPVTDPVGMSAVVVVSPGSWKASSHATRWYAHEDGIGHGHDRCLGPRT